MRALRFLAAFAALFLAALGAEPAFAAGPGALTYASPTFDTAAGGARFGTGALSGGYANSAAAPFAGYTITQGAIGVWARCTPAQANSGVLVSGFNSFYLQVNTSGQIVPNFTSLTGTTAKSICDSALHYVELDFGATSSALFIDGVRALYNRYTTAPTFAFGTTLGIRSFNSGSVFAGEVDEVTLWNAVQHTANFTPATAPYAGTETNLVALYRLNGATDTGNVVDSPSAEPSPAAATTYTFTGPTRGLSGAPSTNFALLANGSLASASTVTVTPSDGSAFNVTLPAGTNPGAYFNYTPASTGAKTLNLSATSLTNPSTATNYAYTADLLIPTNTTSHHFSPANWECQANFACPAGVTQPRTFYAGAYYCMAWNASSSPYANLLFSANGLASPVTVWVNGTSKVSQVTSGGNLVLTGVIASARNHAMVLVQNTINGGSQWNQGSAADFYGLEADGLEVDAASSADVALTPCQPSARLDIAYKGWVGEHSDSLGIGFATNDIGTVQGGGFTQGVSWYVGQALLEQGYDFSAIGVSGLGIVTAAGAVAPTHPGFYYYSPSTGYSQANSSWNLIDAGVSNLDSNGHLSSDGNTGHEPAMIIDQAGSSDVAASSESYCAGCFQPSLQGKITAIIAAAPNVKYIWIANQVFTAGSIAGLQQYDVAQPTAYLTFARNVASNLASVSNFTYYEPSQRQALWPYRAGNIIDDRHLGYYGNLMNAQPILALAQSKLTAMTSKPTFRPGFIN